MIKVQRAIESPSINASLLLESVVQKFGVQVEPYEAMVGQYKVVGRFRADWRKTESAERNWSSTYGEWLITPGPLPQNAQAIVTPSTSSQPASMIAPVGLPNKSKS